MARPPRRTVLVGVGNPARGDDAAGRSVARRMRGTVPAEVEIREHDGETASLLALLEVADRAFLVDASRSGAAAGTVRRFDASAGPLPAASLGLSTHGLGVAEALELARVLGRLPPQCVVYAIEADSTAVGTEPSGAVRAAVEEVSGRLRAELEDRRALEPTGERLRP